MPPLIREAMPEDAARIGAIARAAYAKYVPRIGRELPPMVADFPAEVARRPCGGDRHGGSGRRLHDRLA